MGTLNIVVRLDAGYRMIATNDSDAHDSSYSSKTNITTEAHMPMLKVTRATIMTTHRVGKKTKNK